VTYIPNSIEARDVASLVHMQTHLRKHQQEGPLVITRGDGCHVYDNSGREYIESIAGLWCASLGFASERLAKVAYEQMRSLTADAVVESHSHPDVRSSGPDADRIRTLDPNSEIDSIVALASEAIRYVDQKK
jgi:adenosylmethionine-8-amino-7-oxononanoate aminotransferase